MVSRKLDLNEARMVVTTQFHKADHHPLMKKPKKKSFINNMGIALSRPSYKQVTDLADAIDPDDVLSLVQDTPALANTNLSDDAWSEEYILQNLLDMKHVKVHHVEGVFEEMSWGTKKKLYKKNIVHKACKNGCENDIIMFLIRQYPGAACKKDLDGKIPLYHLLRHATALHVPAIEKLLELSSTKVKKDIPGYIQRALANKDCPQEILDQLTDIGQGLN